MRNLKNLLAETNKFMQANTRIKVACDVLKKMKELTTEF